tara:strand:- start:19579 stop:21996 length:2418 start_codon:yes stop_codon:yes gene_type:complete
MYTLTNTALIVKLNTSEEEEALKYHELSFICAGSRPHRSGSFHAYPRNFKNSSIVERDATFDSIKESKIGLHLKNNSYLNSCVFVPMSSDERINTLKKRFLQDQVNELRYLSNGYRHCNYSPITREDFALEHILYALNLKKKNSWQTADGTIHVSHFPKAFIKNFRKRLKVENCNFIFNSDLAKEKIETSSFFKCNPSNGITEIEFTVSPREYNFSGVESPIKHIADMVHFSNAPEDTKISYIEFSNCSRGAKPISHKFTTSLTPPKAAHSFFIYEKRITALIESDGELVDQELVYYGLGTFSELKIFNKYKKFLIYFKSFVKNIKKYDGSFLLDPLRFKEEIKKVYLQYSKYWKKIPSYMQAFDPSIFAEIYSNSGYSAKGIHLEPDSVNGLGVLSTFTNIPSYRKINNLKKVIFETTAEVSKKEKVLANKSFLSDRHLEKVDRINRRMLALQEEMECENTHHKKLKKEWSESQAYLESNIAQTLASMNSQLEQLNLRYENDLDQAVSEAYNSSYGNLFLNNLKKDGISIDSINYLFKDSNKIVSTNDDPTLIVKAKKESMLNSPNLVLESICFTIQKPVIIRVDYAEKGENCKKIVGGPYCVELHKNNLSIGLLTSNSLHGDNGREAWVHPHTSAFNIVSVREPLKMLAQTMQRACLGEAQAPIFNAFKTADPKMAIYAAMTWITSANSSDAWGKYWKHFPTVDSINFEESDYEANKLKRIFEDKLKSTENIISDFIPSDFSIPTPWFSAENDLNEAINHLIENETNPPALAPIVESLEEEVISEEDPYSNFTEYVPFTSQNT